MEQSLGVVGRQVLLGGGAAKDRLGQAGGAREEFGPLAGSGPCQGGLEQLAYDPEPKVPLQFTTTRCQHGHFRQAGAPTDLLQQTRLSDPRRPLDQRQPPSPRARVPQQPLKLGELLFALEQDRGPSVRLRKLFG